MNSHKLDKNNKRFKMSTIYKEILFNQRTSKVIKKFIIDLMKHQMKFLTKIRILKNTNSKKSNNQAKMKDMHSYINLKKRHH